MSNGKKILVVYTGGTIGSVPTADGLAPAAPGEFSKLIHALPKLRQPGMPDFDVYECDPLIDSSNATPETWMDIASIIAENYAAYDGFVVLHGTDTLAYTSSALSFMLEKTGKPVIVTGSQIPLSQSINDAENNIFWSLNIAGNLEVPEVCTFFYDRLLRGARTVKVDADNWQAFDSPRAPLLGKLENGFNPYWENIRDKPEEPFSFTNQFSRENVVALRLFNGITQDFFARALQNAPKGIVIEYNGTNINDPGVAGVLGLAAQAARDGAVVVVTASDLSHLKAFKKSTQATSLLESGILINDGLSVEAVVAKLSALFSQGVSAVRIKAALAREENQNGDIEIFLPGGRKAFAAHAATAGEVVAIKIFPGMTADLLGRMLTPPPKGVVLECYGTGNGPDRDAVFLGVLKRATDQGAVIVGVSECLKGTAVLGTYAAGTALAKAGVIGGADMTTEAAVTKLNYLLRQGKTVEEIRTEIQKNLCGEMKQPVVRSSPPQKAVI